MTAARKKKAQISSAFFFPGKESQSMSWYLSLGIILVGGGLIAFLFPKIRLPALLGYLCLGLLLGTFNLMAPEILSVSSEIRKFALLIILLKAGLNLNLKDLKKVGRPAILMSFVPACVEMCAVGLLGPYILGLSYMESFILGSVLGAVSPAVVVPRMTKLLDEGYGVDQGIPQLIIAGSSMDDIVMIVFFNSFLSLETGGDLSWMTFMNIPISIVTGVAVGIGVGFLLILLYSKVKMRDSIKLTILLGIALLFVALEDVLSKWFSFSSLLAVLTMGIVLLLKKPDTSHHLASKCDKLWVPAEIFLFVLVGASLNVTYLGEYILPALLMILLSLAFRTFGVQACLIKTPFNIKERTYISLSYLPKATVQAALGGTLLDTGTALGNDAMIKAGTIVLAVSVCYILLTAPLSAFAMDLSYKHLLQPRREIGTEQIAKE